MKICIFFLVYFKVNCRRGITLLLNTFICISKKIIFYTTTILSHPVKHLFLDNPVSVPYSDFLSP